MKPKTTVTQGNTFDRKWHLVDLQGKTLGRISVAIATILQGKNKVDYSPIVMLATMWWRLTPKILSLPVTN